MAGQEDDVGIGELARSLAPGIAEFLSSADFEPPDPIIGALAERAKALPADEYRALLDRLGTADREAFLVHAQLMDEREALTSRLLGRMAEGPDLGSIPSSLARAELRVQMETYFSVLRLAWKVILHMHNAGETDASAALSQVCEEDPELREFAQYTGAALAWGKQQ